MPLATEEKPFHNPRTLDVCLPSLDDIVSKVKPRDVSRLLFRLADQPWIVQSLMRPRLMAAAYRMVNEGRWAAVGWLQLLVASPHLLHCAARNKVACCPLVCKTVASSTVHVPAFVVKTSDLIVFAGEKTRALSCSLPKGTGSTDITSFAVLCAGVVIWSLLLS